MKPDANPGLTVPSEQRRGIPAQAGVPLFYCPKTGRKGTMEKEKTINLKNDSVFRHVVRLNENRNYRNSADAVSDAVRRRARAVSARIAVLARRGVLDSVDLRIIDLRQRSPMPTWREMGNVLHLPKSTVHYRCQKIVDAINTGV